MKVLKFGGSSVGTPDMIKKCVNIILEENSVEDTGGIVVSAFQGVTNLLIEIAKKAQEGDESFSILLNNLGDRHIHVVDDLIAPYNRGRILAEVKVHLNSLEDLIEGVYLIKELSPRTLDYVMSFGEQLSAYIISQYLNQEIKSRNNLSVKDAISVDARNYIVTYNKFGNARVKFKETYEKIRSFYATNRSLKVITGFIASTEENQTTTLGRGGSDYTAAIFAAAIDASMLEIWTDVDGVMTADPRKVKQAFSIPSMTYEEAMELCHFGAKVIYPPTMIPVLERNIPLKIKNTFKPHMNGTLITNKNPASSKLQVTGVTSISDITLLRVQGSGMIGIAGFANRLFDSLASKDISIILITQASSEHTICLAVEPQYASISKSAIEEEFSVEISSKLIDPVIVENDLSIVSVIGEGMRNTPGIAAKLFTALAKNGISAIAIAQGSSELNISVAVAAKHEAKAVNAIHEGFFLSNTKTLNVFLAGTGLIGKTLIRQVISNYHYLLKEYQIEFKFRGISNSKKMYVTDDEIDLNEYTDILERKGEAVDLEKYIKNIQELDLPNSIFVDCTASEAVPKLYSKILDAHISIVTPNKKGLSASYNNYLEIKNSCKRKGTFFLYETSVGAGLPVINTLIDLLRSGDKIIKIEAVLSGTLSYLFNTYNGVQSFSDLLMEAKNYGFTEPDPREDLTGTDVARKILILARECGVKIELNELKIENLIPEGCRDASTVEEFFEKLRDFDKEFLEIYKNASKENKRLRYIASLEEGRVSIRLRSVDEAHPFFSISGNDNIISFQTERYKEKPLIVKGPGAGAEVTAAGVFADIIRLSHYALS
jgi:bifunctional aspartokinase / homoserine dehydrogenase 1